MKDEFDRLSFEQKVSYLVENLRDIPEELVEEGVETLVRAGEIEYAVVLARDGGLIERAIGILVEEGDYLWAALIARNAGRREESERLYREGLEYYIERELFGRAVSAAEALGMPHSEIDELFRRGIETESRGMDLAHTRSLIDHAMDSLEVAILGRGDELSSEIMREIQRRRDEAARGQRTD